MKIKNVAIKNFRGYSDEINSDFEDLTAFVGKNDIHFYHTFRIYYLRLKCTLYYYVCRSAQKVSP